MQIQASISYEVADTRTTEPFSFLTQPQLITQETCYLNRFLVSLMSGREQTHLRFHLAATAALFGRGLRMSGENGRRGEQRPQVMASSACRTAAHLVVVRSDAGVDKGPSVQRMLHASALVLHLKQHTTVVSTHDVRESVLLFMNAAARY